MISLKKYLHTSNDELTTTALRAIALLFEGLATGAVMGDVSEFAAFQTEIRDLEREFEESCSSPRHLEIVQMAVYAMEHYNRGIADNHEARVSEMRSMLGMLTDTLVQQTEGSETAVQSLQSISHELETISQIEDVRIVKRRLAESLKNLHEETARQKTASARLVEELRTTISHAIFRDAVEASGGDTDLTTGLPGWRKAELEVSAALADSAGRYAALFRVERLDSIRARFGAAASQEVLVLCAGQIRTKLETSDQLFRWKGAAFLAILAREGPPDTIYAEIKRLASMKICHTIMVGNRSVLLPVATSFTLLPLRDYPSFESLVTAANSFVAEPRTANGPALIPGKPVRGPMPDLPSPTLY